MKSFFKYWLNHINNGFENNPVSDLRDSQRSKLLFFGFGYCDRTKRRESIITCLQALTYQLKILIEALLKIRNCLAREAVRSKVLMEVTPCGYDIPFGMNPFEEGKAVWHSIILLL